MQKNNLPKTLFSLRLFPILLGFISGFSVFYFLYFFGAYGIQRGLSYSGHTHLFRSVSFGGLTFGYITALEAGLKPRLKIAGRRYLALWYVGLVVMGIQLIFLLFNYFWNWQEWNLEAYGLIVKEFPLMMVLPLTVSLLLKTLAKPPDGAEAVYLSFLSENGKDQLKVKLQDFLYANASENYIEISYLSKGEIKQHLIRKTLKALERELAPYPEVQRIHRSYIVNRQNVEAVKQSKGKVSLDIQGVSIPVSKQYQSHFLG